MVDQSQAPSIEDAIPVAFGDAITTGKSARVMGDKNLVDKRARTLAKLALVSSAIVLTALAALGAYTFIEVGKAKRNGTDVGEVNFDSESGELWGGGVDHLIKFVDEASHKKAQPSQVHEHEDVKIHLIHAHKNLAGRSLSGKDLGLAVDAEVDVETRLRTDLPASAETIEDDKSGKTHLTAILQMDNTDQSALDIDCDGKSCAIVHDSRRQLSTELKAEKVARWVCALTCKMSCTLVTKLIEVLMVTWVCEPVAEFLCDDVLGANGHKELLWHNKTVHATCKEAVQGTCEGKYPLETARDTLRRSFLRAFGVDEYSQEHVPDFLNHLLTNVAGLPVNNVTAVLESTWVEKVEEVCEKVCADWCTKIVVVIYTWLTTCFPADASVKMLPAPGAEPLMVPISSVSVGDMVLTPHGFEPIYFQGHASASFHPYIRVMLDSKHTLELSPDHYLPTGDEGFILAKDAKPGMTVYHAGAKGTSESSRIASVETTVLAGAYNPYTPSGELIVNDVHASCHSSWFLEGSMAASLVPPTYQALLAPIRNVYAIAPGVVQSFCDRFAGDDRPMSELKLGEVLRTLSAAYNAPAALST